MRPYRLLHLCLLLPLALRAQTAAPAPDLGDTLRRLQENLWSYQSTVPDFFADEHVVSTLKQEGARDVKTTTDSTFRLARSHQIGESSTFTESREVRLVNKKPTNGEKIQGPAIFSGAFSSAVGIVSFEMSRCFDYTIEPPATLNKAAALLISYIYKPEAITDDGCPSQEKQSGRAWFDPADLHILRVETVVPNHWDQGSHQRTLWTWSVDYGPVTFDGKQFWLPKTITSRAEANDASGIWTFIADYSNYHKLTVKSRIITDTSTPQ